MKILVLGSGAREHAIAWKFSKSNRITGLYIAPGNAGTDELGENLDVNPLDLDAVVQTCRQKKIDFVFVGPEGPLAAGIVDRLDQEKIPVFGPHREAAKLESSKTFSKQFMLRHRIPTARADEFRDFQSFKAAVLKSDGPMVVKKNGLASGKGVLESSDKEEMLAFGEAILRNDTLLLEEFLVGYEISLFALTDGSTFTLLPPTADFKKAFDGDKGSNTGGMGAICPVPVVDSKMIEKVKREIVEPTFKGMAQEGLQYKGVLYFGLMVTKKGPYLLEYNARFGDPETQVLLPVISSDFLNLCEAVHQGKLGQFNLQVSEDSSLGVVVASPGYPGTHPVDIPVSAIPKVQEKQSLIFHANTRIDSAKRVLTTGGRCFTVVGRAASMFDASRNAYETAAKIGFEGAWFRKDIGIKFFID